MCFLLGHNKKLWHNYSFFFFYVSLIFFDRCDRGMSMWGQIRGCHWWWEYSLSQHQEEIESNYWAISLVIPLPVTLIAGKLLSVLPSDSHTLHQPLFVSGTFSFVELHLYLSCHCGIDSVSWSFLVYPS